MIYPPEFVARVKTAYPDNTALHKALDTGDVNAVGYFCPLSACLMKPQEILSSYLQGGEDRARAVLAIERVELYCEWFKLFSAHCKANPDFHDKPNWLSRDQHATGVAVEPKTGSGDESWLSEFL